MIRYEKTVFEDALSVSSLINARYYDLRGRRVEGVSHPFWKIFCVLSGEDATTLDGAPVFLREGSALLCPPDSFHGDPSPSLSHCVAGIISFEGNCPLLASLSGKEIPLSAHLLSRFRRLLDEASLLVMEAPPHSQRKGMLPRDHTTSAHLQRLKLHLELFLLDMYEEESARRHPPHSCQKQEEQMCRLDTYLSRHLSENHTCQSLATAMGMSVSALRKTVYEQKHCGPLSYFLSLKLDEAKNLLTESAMTASEIASHLGFSDLSHFSRHFKNNTGLSPGAYRKQHHSLR